MSDRVSEWHNYDKNAELSQRWPRDAPYIWVPCRFSGVPDKADSDNAYVRRVSTFPKVFTARCYAVSQNAVMPQYVVRLSVCLSVCPWRLGTVIT